MDMNERKAYIDFMWDPTNAYCCDDCPERFNSNMHDGLPCGQQMCWVVAHTLDNSVDDRYLDDDDYVEVIKDDSHHH